MMKIFIALCLSLAMAMPAAAVIRDKNQPFNPILGSPFGIIPMLPQPRPFVPVPEPQPLLGEGAQQPTPQAEHQPAPQGSAIGG